MSLKQQDLIRVRALLDKSAWFYLRELDILPGLKAGVSREF